MFEIIKKNCDTCTVQVCMVESAKWKRLNRLSLTAEDASDMGVDELRQEIECFVSREQRKSQLHKDFAKL